LRTTLVREGGEHVKRAAELRSLSEDHHHSLVNARRLRQVASEKKDAPEEAARAFLEFWQKDTSIHFRQEEEVLLPVLARYAGEPDQESVVLMLAQHARIRGLIMGLSDEVTGKGVRPETLQSIGEALEEHIRLEEREVFPLVEDVLPQEGLKELAARLEINVAGPRAEPWVQAEDLTYESWPGPGDSEGGGWD
jgi:iron-sulfur cluster repair protein YtfE (RIC family)